MLINVLGSEVGTTFWPSSAGSARRGGFRQFESEIGDAGDWLPRYSLHEDIIGFQISMQKIQTVQVGQRLTQELENLDQCRDTELP